MGAACWLVKTELGIIFNLCSNCIYKRRLSVISSVLGSYYTTIAVSVRTSSWRASEEHYVTAPGPPPFITATY